MLLLAAGALPAAEQTVRVPQGSFGQVDLPWPYEESALQEPRGYNHHGRQAHHLMRQVVVENTSAFPLEGGEVTVDRRHWEDEIPQTKDAGALFTWWTQARSHAASGLKAAQDPWVMLRLWSYTLCGEDTKALSTLLAARQVPGRSVPLNGHVAGEYQFNGRWSVIDGDQNIVYLNLDNRTLASYAEIRADPFLALRTKPFGRFAQVTPAAAQFNTGLFEYIEPAASKPFKLKKSEGGPAPSPLTLYPGERLIYYYDRWPEIQVGDAKAPEWRQAAPFALRLVELQALPKARGWKQGALAIKTPDPILSAHNNDTGEHAAVIPAELVYSCNVPVAHDADRISVWMQRSRSSLPEFKPGKNHIAVNGSKNPQEVTVQLLYNTENLPARPAAPVVTSAEIFRDAAPRFEVSTEEGCDRIWWQLAANEPSFWFVPPNFEQIQEAAPMVVLDALSNTFLNDRTDYYVRAKSVRKGVWSEWSPPVKFRVEKPLAPTDLTAAALPDGRVRLQWKGPGEEFAVFASNRLDFLPDIYAPEQIISMRGQEVLGRRANQNRVALVKEHAVELTPTGRYFRILARRGEAWSNPSPLLTLPVELSRHLPPPVVFQIRWTNKDGVDSYLGEERALP